MENVPIYLDPSLISNFRYTDKYQKNPELIPLFHLIGRLNEENYSLSDNYFADITTEALEEAVKNEQEAEQRKKVEDKDKDINKYEDIFESTSNIDTDDVISGISELTTKTANEAEEGKDAFVDKLNDNKTINERIDDEETTETLKQKLEVAKKEEKNFQESKLSLISYLSTAVNEASLALDFISLLVSSVRPAAANSLMSPLLKSLVPPGSLNSDKIPSMSTNERSLVNPALISWKLASLEKCMKFVLKKEESLKRQVLKDIAYYKKLFDISYTKSDNNAIYNEVFFKLNEAEIGLKLGYTDSGSNFRKSIAVLKRNENSDVVDFKIQGHLDEKVVHVYVYKNQSDSQDVDGDIEMLDSSDLQAAKSSAANNDLILDSIAFDDCVNPNKSQDIKNEIIKGRNLVFEQELFYQIINEAKLLLPYDVLIISDDCVSIEFEDMSIHIKYKKPDIKIEKHSKSNDNKASYILNLFKLMLCRHHKTNLYNNLTVNPTVSNDVLLLRPLIGHINHERFVKKLVKCLVDLHKETLFKDISLSKLDYKKKNEKPISLLRTSQYDGAINNEVIDIQIIRNYKLKKCHNGDIFNKVTTPTKTLFTWVVYDRNDSTQNQNINLLVKTSSDSIYCDYLVNLTLIRGTREILNVNYSDLNEISKCLKWIYKNKL